MLTASLAVGLATLSPATAAPLVYDEAVDGELGVVGQPIFSFDTGTNRVAGQVRFIAGLDVPVAEWQFDSDDFYFEIPSDAYLRTITLSWSTDLLPDTWLYTASLDFSWADDAFDPPLFGHETTSYSFLTNRSGVQPFSSQVPPPASADIFRLFMFSSAGLQGPTGQRVGGVISYEWAVDVAARSPVPEPGTLALLALGLIGLLVTRRSLHTRSMPASP